MQAETDKGFEKNWLATVPLKIPGNAIVKVIMQDKIDSVENRLQGGI